MLISFSTFGIVETVAYDIVKFGGIISEITNIFSNVKISAKLIALVATVDKYYPPSTRSNRRFTDYKLGFGFHEPSNKQIVSTVNHV